ncbi:MAG: nitroreductase family protein [Candidatus Aminicenantaceae bacterium]
MSVLEVIKKRHSIRKYKADPVPKDKFHRVMEAARLAPSGKNFQPWKFIVVQDNELKRKLAEASRGQKFIAEAPIVITACGYPDRSYQKQGNYMTSWTIDVAVAVEHLMLQACEEGLGTCWIGAFDEPQVKTVLDIPEHVRVLGLTPLGYPDQEPRDRGRKSLGEVISYDRY